MRFIANSSILHKKLSHLSGLILPNPMQDILKTLLFELKEQSLSITASDADTMLTVEMEVQEVQSTGEICIPAKLLIDYLRNLSDQPISLHVNADKTSVDIASDSGKYRINTQDAGDFPREAKLEDPKSLSLPSDFLLYGLKKTLFAINKDIMRPAMTGLFFEITGEEFTFASTDSHRLIQVTLKGSSFPFEAEGFILPKKSAEFLLGLVQAEDSPVKIQFDERSVTIEGDQFRLSSRLVDAQFPPYRTVIPTDNPYTLTINRQEFFLALKRISLFSDKSTNLFTMEIIGNSVRLRGHEQDLSYEGLETLSCQYNGEDMKLAFNANLAVDLLAHLSTEEIAMELSTPSRACIFRETDMQEQTDMLMLLMPLKVVTV